MGGHLVGLRHEQDLRGCIVSLKQGCDLGGHIVGHWHEQVVEGHAIGLWQ